MSSTWRCRPVSWGAEWRWQGHCPGRLSSQAGQEGTASTIVAAGTRQVLLGLSSGQDDSVEDGIAPPSVLPVPRGKGRRLAGPFRAGQCSTPQHALVLEPGHSLASCPEPVLGLPHWLPTTTPAAARFRVSRARVWLGSTLQVGGRWPWLLLGPCGQQVLSPERAASLRSSRSGRSHSRLAGSPPRPVHCLPLPLLGPLPPGPWPSVRPKLLCPFHSGLEARCLPCAGTAVSSVASELTSPTVTAPVSMGPEHSCSRA